MLFPGIHKTLMLLLPKLDRSIKEFQQTIHVPEYDAVIEKILRKADALGIQVSFWGEDYSMAEDRDGVYYIRIRRKAASGNRKELVYDMMHELGHCLDPIKLGIQNQHNHVLRLDREIRAWAMADQEFNSHPELQNDSASYVKYQNDCLVNYIKAAAKYGSQ